MSSRGRHSVSCPVELVGCSPFGEYCNAFRVVTDSQTEVLLDFCIYSARENKARCVARVRVNTSFLAEIHERMGHGLTEVRAETDSGQVAPLYLFRLPGGDEDN